MATRCDPSKWSTEDGTRRENVVQSIIYSSADDRSVNGRRVTNRPWRYKLFYFKVTEYFPRPLSDWIRP